MNRRHFVGLVVTTSLRGAAWCLTTPASTTSECPPRSATWTVGDVTPDPQSDFGKGIAEFASVFMDAAGATATTGVWRWFEVRDAGGVLVTKVDGYQVAGATPDALWRGADGIGFTNLAPAGTTSGGWDLRRVTDGGGWIAVRGDRLFDFSGGPGPTQDQVQRFLEALR